MDIDAMLKSIGVAPQPSSDVDDTANKIEHLTLKCAAKCDGAAETTSTIVMCMIGATLPLINALFSEDNGKAPAQDRLLFSLVLAGAITSVKDKRDSFDVSVGVNPDSIREAIETYTKLTGKDISRYLPPMMVKYAKGLPQETN